MIHVSPSLLAADFAHLSRELGGVKQSGADMIHLDVMDGVFVPNLSFGLPVIESIRRVSDLVFDAHLMIEDPYAYIDPFCDAGCDFITFHLESKSDVQKTIDKIHARGKKCGLSIKPATPADALIPYLSSIDMVLVMSVEPGFGGQRFMADQLPKIAALHERILQVNPGCELEVDGGIDPETAPLVKQAGANVLVAGSAVFRRCDRAAAIAAIRNA